MKRLNNSLSSYFAIYLLNFRMGDLTKPNLLSPIILNLKASYRQFENPSGQGLRGIFIFICLELRRNLFQLTNTPFVT